MKKILIFGGNGYIGSRLSLELSRLGYAITPVCFPSQPQDREWVSMMEEIITGSITDPALLKQLAEKDYDTVINLVSLDHRASNGNPEIVSNVNVMPSWNFLNLAAQRGTIKKFIYFSTVQVYGRVEAGTVVSETHAVAPVNAYGLTHAMCEDICNYYNRISEINCINVRLSNSYALPVFADANCWWLIINDLCRQAIESRKLYLLSDGRPQRDFINHVDLVRAITLLIEKNVITENTFNLCSGQTFTIMEIASLIRETYFQLVGTQLPIFTPDGECDVVQQHTLPMEDKIIFDRSRLSSELGFSPEVEIKRGIQVMLETMINAS